MPEFAIILRITAGILAPARELIDFGAGAVFDIRDIFGIIIGAADIVSRSIGTGARLPSTCRRRHPSLLSSA